VCKLIGPVAHPRHHVMFTSSLQLVNEHSADDTNSSAHVLVHLKLPELAGCEFRVLEGCRDSALQERIMFLIHDGLGSNHAQ
jgi:hypothetical protein